MAIVMTANQLVAKLKDIVANYKTIYVYGSIGGIVTNSLINQKKAQYPSFYTASRTAKIRATVGKGYFGFDCVNVIKSILWGWNGNKNAAYGGAKYCSNGVPDVSADGMISLCKNVSSSGWSRIQVGEAVWMSGHIGVYIGNGLVIECTPKWNNCVQISGLGNIGKTYNGKTRTWTKHGKIPYVSYTSSSSSTTTTGTAVNKTMYTTGNVNFRKGAGTSYAIIATLPTGTAVNVISKVSDNWYKATYNGTTGYISAKYVSTTKPNSEATTQAVSGYIITKKEVELRKTPNWSETAIATYPANTKFTVTEKVLPVSGDAMYKTKSGYYVTANSTSVTFHSA